MLRRAFHGWHGETGWSQHVKVSVPYKISDYTAYLLQTHRDASVREHDRTLRTLEKNPSDRTQATSNCTKSMVILHELALQDLASGVLNLESLKKLGDKWEATAC